MSFSKSRFLKMVVVHIHFWNMISYDIIWYHMTSYDIIWHHMISYEILWYHMTLYDIIWHHMISYYIIRYHMTSYVLWYNMISYEVIWYHMIAAADAAAETSETKGKPKLFHDFWLWKWQYKKTKKHKILWNVSTVIRNEMLYRKMVGSFSNLFSGPGLWPSNFLT